MDDRSKKNPRRIKYAALKRKAKMESPPGSYTLYLGAYDTRRTGDRSFVEKAVLAARGSVSEGDLQQIYGAALFDCGYTDEGLAEIIGTVTYFGLDGGGWGPVGSGACRGKFGGHHT